MHLSSNPRHDRQLAINLSDGSRMSVLTYHLAINWARHFGKWKPSSELEWLHWTLKHFRTLTKGFDEIEILLLWAHLTFNGGVANSKPMKIAELKPTLNWLSQLDEIKLWRAKVSAKHSKLNLVRGVVGRTQEEAKLHLLRPIWGYREEQALYYIKMWKKRHEGDGWLATAQIDPQHVYLPQSGDEYSPYHFSEFFIDTDKLENFTMRQVSESELDFKPDWLLSQPGYEQPKTL
jgi:hypothetical protein